MAFKVPEVFRLLHGPLASRADRDGNNGMFILPPFRKGSNLSLRVLATDQMGWEHVSVSLKGRCPYWDEMCHVKSLFWDDEDCVMQLHPPRSQWVNNHNTCLHLWRPLDAAIPQPPSILVGIQDAGTLA
jgi:hypothetical protein